MLGLGDIVIPGIFVALCVRYDINRVLLKSTKKLNLHDVVYTSGKDGVLPPGIQIGEVISFDEKPLINLFSDFNQLSYVNIVIEDLGILKKEMN